MTPVAPHAAKTLMRAGLAALGLMALAACGHADNAAEAGSADNVEIPAEEAMSGLPGGAVPMADAESAASSGE